MFGIGTGSVAAATAEALRTAAAPPGAVRIPTGQFITATAAPGSRMYELSTGLRSDRNADAAEAVTTALSPDGTKLLVLTSGYNFKFSDEATGAPIVHPVLDPLTGAPTATTTSNAEWVFVYDVTGATPKKLEQIDIPNTYAGLVWDPSGKRFYVSGGIDDRVYVFKATGGAFVADAPFLILGHNTNGTAPFPNYDGGILNGTPAAAKSGGKLQTGAVVAGIGVSADGKTLVAANFENDSITLADTATRKPLSDVKFFLPGQREARGEYPYWIAVRSAADGSVREIYVSSQRDDQVIAVAPDGTFKTIPVPSGPNRLLLSADQKTLYVSDGNDDSIALIDTASDRVARVIALHPNDPYRGANPNSLALGPGGDRLYVTLGGENAVAIVSLPAGRVIGMIPTGWYPNSVSVGKDGKTLYVVNAKSDVGPNPANGRTTAFGTASNATHRNDYNWAKEKAGLLVIPLPGSAQLAHLTRVVLNDNGFSNRRPDATMASLRGKIKHVIYVVKENRTYDQVLGDLPGTNGDPRLNLFPKAVGPNHHALASEFVTLDNFYDPGESSGVGWNWTMAGHTTDFTEKSQSVLYGNASFHGLTYDYQGTNRNVNVALPQTGATIEDSRVTGLLDPSGGSSILPGTKDVAETEGSYDDATGAVGGYLWDAALRARKTVRNYGWQSDFNYYESGTPFDPALVRHPFEAHVAQSVPAAANLRERTDVYFRAFDQRYPDTFRIEEWEREFNEFVVGGNLPDLEVMTINHDHFGSFETAIEGLTTPTLQFADDDYALGRLVADVAASRYWKDTAIFVLEDDSQNGPDHVDGHRSIAYVISAYTKRRAVVHTAYTTVNVLRTIEDLLGVRPLGMNDANAAPMSELFGRLDLADRYAAYVPGVLCAPPVAADLVPACKGPQAAAHRTPPVRARRDGAWWAAQTRGFDFRTPDKIDADAFNRILWEGLRGDRAPYPGGAAGTQALDD